MSRYRYIKITTLFIILGLVVSSVSACRSEVSSYKKQFLGAFDTVIGLVMHTDDEKEFDRAYEYTQSRFNELHQKFDIYNDYDGINNIKTINDNAGVKPIEVSSEIVDLIELSLQWYEKSNGRFNIAFGPVLKIWHDYRERANEDDLNPAIPTYEELEKASLFTSIEDVKLDKEKSTVYLSNENMRIDVGAVAKGYAAQIVLDELVEQGYDNFAINAGGNVLVKGSPLSRERDLWVIAIEDPDKYIKEDPGDGYINKVSVKDTSVVTSGWYQRYFISGGEIYHHIIDPDTLFPNNHFKAVTIIHPDSGISDILSTTLMLMTYEEGLEYLEEIPGAMAFWVLDDGTVKATENIKEMLEEKVD